MNLKSKQVQVFQSPKRLKKNYDLSSPLNNFTPSFEEGMFLKILIKDVDEEGGSYQLKGQNSKILGLSCDVFVNQVLEQRTKYYNKKILEQLGYQNTIIPNVITLFITKNDIIQFSIFDSSQPHQFESTSFQNNFNDNLILHDYEKKLGERILDYSFFSDLVMNKSYKWISFPRISPVLLSSEKRKMGYIKESEEKQMQESQRKLQQNNENIIKVLFEFERIPLKTLSPMKKMIEDNLEHYQDPLDENHPAVLNRITDILTDLNCLKAFSNYQQNNQQHNLNGQFNSFQRVTQMQNYLLNLQLTLHNRYSSAITTLKQSSQIHTPIKPDKTQQYEKQTIQNFQSPEQIKKDQLQEKNGQQGNGQTENAEGNNNKNDNKQNKQLSYNKNNSINEQTIDNNNTYQIRNNLIQLNKVASTNSNQKNSSNHSANKLDNLIQLNYHPQTQSYEITSGQKHSNKKQMEQKVQQIFNVNRNELESIGYDEICDDLQKIQQDVLLLYDNLHQARYFRAYLDENNNIKNNSLKQNLDEKMEKNEKLHKILYQYTEQIRQNGMIDGNIDNKLNILHTFQDRLLEDAKICSEELDNLYKKEQLIEKKVKRLKESNSVIAEDLNACVDTVNKMKQFNLNTEKVRDFTKNFKNTDFQTKEMQQIFDNMYNYKHENLKLEEYRNNLKRLKLQKEQQKKGYKIFSQIENTKDLNINQYFKKFIQENGREIPHNQWKIDNNFQFYEDYDEEEHDDGDEQQFQEEQITGEDNQIEEEDLSKKNISYNNQEQYFNDQSDFINMQNSSLKFEENNQILKEIKERKSAINNLLNAIDNI